MSEIREGSSTSLTRRLTDYKDSEGEMATHFGVINKDGAGYGVHQYHVYLAVNIMIGICQVDNLTTFPFTLEIYSRQTPFPTSVFYVCL